MTARKPGQPRPADALGIIASAINTRVQTPEGAGVVVGTRSRHDGQQHVATDYQVWLDGTERVLDTPWFRVADVSPASARVQS